MAYALVPSGGCANSPSSTNIHTYFRVARSIGSIAALSKDWS